MLIKEQVKKHVAAIHTNGFLSLIERKMINVLLLNAYDSLLTRRTHSIPIRHLCVMLGWEESHNTDRLKSVLRSLSSTTVEFNIMDDGKLDWKVMSMLSYGDIKDGICTYRYDEYLAERLYDPEIYATINIGVQRRFEGSYALILYENCLRYKVVGSTGWWDINRFRKLVGASAAVYDEFKYLKRDVIMKPMEEVNRISDIQLDVEFKKQGRKVTDIRFLISENPQQTLLKPVIDDEQEAVRETEIFKRLIEHGIGERLAILWIIQDEDRAKKVVEYVEEKDRKKQVKGTTAGYIRSLIEGNAVVEITPYEEKKQKKEKEKLKGEQQKAFEIRRAELEAEFVRECTTKLVNALSRVDKQAWVKSYIDIEGIEKAKSYNSEKADFRDSLERIQFLAWLRKSFASEINHAEFDVWLKEKESVVKKAIGK